MVVPFAPKAWSGVGLHRGVLDPLKLARPGGLCDDELIDHQGHGLHRNTMSLLPPDEVK